MIINFHPKEIESKKGVEVIKELNKNNAHKVVHATDKTPIEWQDIIKGDEKLVLIAPVYWWGASHAFDKWVQDVFTYGFAYQYAKDGPEGLLNGREFELHMTHGMPETKSVDMRKNIKERMEKGIFGFSNAKVDISFYDMNQ